MPSPTPRILRSSRCVRGVWCLLLTLQWAGSALSASPSIGLPITRTYSIEEIGASRGPSLNFDRLGRLAVISNGSYIVLNDNAWIDLAVHGTSILPVQEIAVDPDGHAYYGALASWGRAETTPDGRILPVSFRPDRYPSWINSSNFTQVVFTPVGILFVGTNGLVFLDPQTDEQRFFETPVATVFTLGDEIYLSSSSYGTQRFDPLTGERTVIDPQIAVHETAAFGNQTLVCATTDNRLVTFDGARFGEPDLGFKGRIPSAIACLEGLPDGGFALSIDGEGLFIFSETGERILSLTTSAYRRIYDIAVRDPGVLWLARESSVEKLLYRNPVSVVDQRSDVVIGWPQVVQQEGRILIASNGRLYEMTSTKDGWSYQFREFPELPTSGAWAIAANARHLLIGNSDGVFSLHGDHFTTTLEDFDANRLFLQEEDLCIVVGSAEIAALRWNGESWEECAPRIAGVGFPSVAHPTEEALWVELGLDRVARIWFEEGSLEHEVFETFPWQEPVWVNIGVLKDYIALSGAHNQRVYLDKSSGRVVSAPRSIEHALTHAPETILRVSEDENGIIWATHPTGILTFHPNENGNYQIDTSSLSSIRDQYPVITLLNGQHAWISTESALYHVEQSFSPIKASTPQPFLVSIKNGKTGTQLYSSPQDSSKLEKLTYAQNHLVFQYFSGGYTPLQEPLYTFSMQQGSQSWRVQTEESLLTLPSLEEGNYRLTAQLYDGTDAVGEPVITTFTIEPPWYRSTIAYLGYWGSGLFICIGVISLGHTRAKRKHDYLEKLVRERTDALRSTMEKLTEEARTSATLAERNRLAGEIHDSLQQGLSGLALQLDATLRLNHLEPSLKSKLNVARKMVSFTRQEVQQAVWDLESPLLQDDELDEALRNMAALLNSGPSRIEIEAQHPLPAFPSRVQHHLLRIAQEAITNAVRHSEADRIQVSLQVLEQQVVLSVVDNGKGFDQNAVLADGLGHFGLRGLQTRASKFGGDLRIESAIGKGTSVHLTVPFPKPTEDND